MRKRKKQKGITPKKDHLGPYYAVRVTRTHPTTGEEIDRRVKVRGTFAYAVEVKAELVREIEAEIAGELTPSMTLGAYALRWFEQKAKEIAASTARKYMNDLERHLLPALGRMRLDELRPSHVRAMFSKDQAAPNTKLNRLRLLRSIAKDAVADRLITWDFTARVTVSVPDVYTEDEPNVLTAEQLGQVLDAFGENWLDALHVLAFTGMRWCEVAGLRWDDLDLDQGVLKIRRGNVKGILGPPKTKKSRRTVGLTADLTRRLSDRRCRMQASRHPGLTKGWVFPRDDGEHYHGYPLRKALIRACKSADIPIRFTTHGLRRTYNNLARNLVENLLVLRATVGHTTEAMTEHYSHIATDEKRELSERVTETVRNRHSDRQSGSEEGPEEGPNPQ